MRALVVAALLLAGCAAQPRRLPRLVAPEIVVSVKGRTVHLFDRATGTQFVYAARLGALDATGHSATPIGAFATGADTSDRWWYMPRRTKPELYGGHPFLRLTATNRRGEHVYGLHGPYGDDGAARGYGSRGCVRLGEQDIRDLFEMVRDHPSTPVLIQEDVEVDATGTPIDVGSKPLL